MDSSARDSSTASELHPSNSTTYNAPDSYRNIHDVTPGAPIQIPSSDVTTGSPVRETRRRSSVGADQYDIPEGWANLDELAATSPVENVAEAPIYRHRSLEQTRSHDQGQRRREHERRRSAEAPPAEEPGEKRVSKLATQIYTLSYLVFFAIFGTLARVGLTALTTYPGTPVLFTTIWANFGGSLIMGFLSEDRMLFHHEQGTPTYDQQMARVKKTENDEESGGSSQERQVIDLVAAKKAHLATKKTIPLYIGLATGFCGSFTSFSSFIRDIFLALSNELATPGLAKPQDRNGGYSFMALLAVIITTISLSLSGLFVGAHLAIASERFTPLMPYPITRRVLDPLAVLLGWGCWLGAVLLAIFPPHDKWRGEVLFAIVFGPLGCISRFYLSVHLNGKIASFPLGTFAANVLGTAVLGMSWDIAHVPLGGVIGCQVLQGIEDGFCGCLTTISTWVAELSSLKRRNAYIYGAASVGASLAVMIAIMGGLRWSDGFSVLKCES